MSVPIFKPTRLRFLGKLKGGAGFPHAAQGDMSAAIPFYKVKDISVTDQKGFLNSTDNYVDTGTARSLGAFVFPRHTVFMAKVGAALLLHRFVRASCPSCIDNNMLGLVPDTSVVHPNFLLYAMNTVRFDDVVNPGAVPSIGAEMVGDRAVLLPPLPTQQAIADFLDRKTAAIDALIDTKQRLIALLTEKRAALIQRAVTQGLDADAVAGGDRSRGSRDAGVGAPNTPLWVEHVPSGWGVRPLRHVATVQNSNVDKKSYEGGLPVRLCNYTDVYYNEYITDGMNFMAATATPKEIAKFELCAGDIIITKDSEIWDDIAVPTCIKANMPGVVCGYHLTMLRPHEDVHGPFLLRVMQADGVRDQFWLAANGVTRFGLSQQGMKDALIPLPPLPTQRAIADFLDRQTATSDALVQKIGTQIERLREYRQSLITAAVTGQIDIKGAA